MSDAEENEGLLIQLGWVVLDGDGVAARERVERASDLLLRHLDTQLPGYRWRSEVVTRRVARPEPQLDPLDLLELGVQVKVERHWDFALVVTSADLKARTRPFTFGVPSSAMETAVISSARSDDTARGETHLVQLARYLFASMLGLEPDDVAMRTPEVGLAPELEDFSPEQCEQLRERLDDVGDPRLEERSRDWSRFGFRVQTLAADPRGILRDVVGYRPWQQPFRLGHLTAAAFLSSLLSFLGAEVWELGIGIDKTVLAGGIAGSILAATWFLFRGQNLSEVTRHARLTEQVARTQIVLWSCLLAGMVTLWLLLCASSFLIATLLPREVVERWLDVPLDPAARLSFAAFVSTLGTLAGALGGNLEKEDNFKAQFFFDEEV